MASSPRQYAMDAKNRQELEPQKLVAELLAQQAAISEVLRAIANSSHELKPTCDTIVVNAMRLCRLTREA